MVGRCVWDLEGDVASVCVYGGGGWEGGVSGDDLPPCVIPLYSSEAAKSFTHTGVCVHVLTLSMGGLVLLSRPESGDLWLSYTHASTHTHVHTHTHMYTHANMHTHIHTRAHAHIHMCTLPVSWILVCVW